MEFKHEKVKPRIVFTETKQDENLKRDIPSVQYIEHNYDIQIY
jgi:hypothetical protein